VPRPILVILIIAGGLVLLGQVWPEGAPPFAKYVNAGFAAASIVAFILALAQRPAVAPPPQAPVEPDEKRLERERLAREAGDARSQVEDRTKRNADLEHARTTLDKEREQAKREKAEVDARLAEAAQLATKLEEARAAKERAEGKLREARDEGALALLSWLQREGRLIDFVMEEIDGYDDKQVGAAVRAIHGGCKKVLDQALALESILPGEDGARVKVEKGFDPVSIQLTGNVRGDPPFSGTLVHHGWRTKSLKLPVSETLDAKVLAPAEVEL
jgi:hypothetical protein